MKEELIKYLSKSIDLTLCSDLIESFIEIRHYLMLEKYKEVLVFTGHFCETVWKIIEFKASGIILKKIKNKNHLIKRFENYTSLSEQERIIIPRITTSVYDLRNRKRSGHSTSIIPTKNDALFTSRTCTYVLVEFLLLYHTDNLKEIYNLIENLISKEIPFIEELEGKIIANKKVSKQILVLYLVYKNKNGFLNRADIIKKLDLYNKKTVQSCLSRLKDDLSILENDNKKIFLTQRGIQIIEDYISKSV